jgi:hypothetical protein
VHYFYRGRWLTLMGADCAQESGPTEIALDITSAGIILCSGASCQREPIRCQKSLHGRCFSRAVCGTVSL